jgi:hypothetical protein
LSRRTEKGRAYGVVTAKAVAVLEALLSKTLCANVLLLFSGQKRKNMHSI